jgi:hypothetical protein
MPAFQFNSNGIDPQYGGGGGGLPATFNGQAIKHPVVIVGTALKPTKDNTGGYLEIVMEAIDGPFKGSQQVDRLNLHNKSADAVRIANTQLSAYCHVTGVFAFNATEELHGKPFLIETKPRSDNPNTFEMAKLFDVNGNEPGKSGSGGAPSGGGNAAWGGGQPQGQQGGGQAQGGGAWGGGAQGGGQPQGDQQQNNQGGGAQQGGNAWGGGNGGGGQGAQPSGGGQWSQGGGGGQPAWGAR